MWSVHFLVTSATTVRTDLRQLVVIQRLFQNEPRTSNCVKHKKIVKTPVGYHGLS